MRRFFGRVRSLLNNVYGGNRTSRAVHKHTGILLEKRIKKLPCGGETEDIGVYLASYHGKKRPVVVKHLRTYYRPSDEIRFYMKMYLNRLVKKREIHSKGFGPRPLALLPLRHGEGIQLLFVEEYVPGKPLNKLPKSELKKRWGGDLLRLQKVLSNKFRIWDVYPFNIIFHEKRGAQIVDFQGPLDYRDISERTARILLSRGIVLRKNIREFFKSD